MEAFRSNQEYFEAVEDLALRLERGGRSSQAAELRRGLGCLNGLTDGWALLLDSINAVRRACGSELSQDQRDDLEKLRHGARLALYRR